MTAMLLPWLLAFVLTELIEAPIYMCAGRLSLAQALVPSALTHPVVWFVFFHPALGLSWLSAVVAAETFAWLVEAVYLRWTAPPPSTTRWALLVSLAANASSFGLGTLLQLARQCGG